MLNDIEKQIKQLKIEQKQVLKNLDVYKLNLVNKKLFEMRQELHKQRAILKQVESEKRFAEKIEKILEL